MDIKIIFRDLDGIVFLSRHSDFSSIRQTTDMPHYSTCNSANGATTLSTTTTSIITFSTMNLIVTFSTYLESHYYDCCYAGCHYAKCSYAECHGALLVIVQTLLTLATLGQHDTNVCVTSLKVAKANAVLS